jgi:shikimate kinase
MASGKSTVGKQLAKELDIKFIDLDNYIEEQEEMTISEIFRLNGETFFRQKEHDYLSEILKNDAGLVLSLGGGTPCFHQNMDLVNQKSTSIHLKASLALLSKRLISESENRPIVASIGVKSMPNFIEKHLKDRNPHYSKAAFTVLVDGKNLTEITKEITLQLGH